ncbi:hypothetical protein [Saccharopolyspora cebuensis]|uniref:DUF892 family protein n=1 Tax=Saccharopolyspora cebuensis TaxID=418759 RepID=A0ABV4CRZ8_9PSEU
MRGQVAALLGQLHDAEAELAAALREVAGRHADDAGTHHPCRTLAGQCDEHARHLRDQATRLGEPPPAHPDRVLPGAGAPRWGGPGAELLADLRELHLRAQDVSLHWVLAGQAAQAIGDQELLGLVSAAHAETRTQARWITTRLKQAAPQVLARD